MKRLFSVAVLVAYFVIPSHGQSSLSVNEISRLQGINSFQEYVPYTDYWRQRKYREYFLPIEEKSRLSKTDARFVGRWIEWERNGDMSLPERLSSANGLGMILLPDKTFIAFYDKYPGSMKVYFLIGQWRIQDNSLFVKNTLMAYTSDPEVRYADPDKKTGLGSNILIHRFDEDWYLFYSDIEKIDWHYGYTYEGFKSLQMPRDLAGPYYDKLRPDIRRALDYSSESDFNSYPLIYFYEEEQKILSGDQKAIRDFAVMHRQLIPKE